MKITPIEIRQHTFEKKGFGGYRPDEVDAFLASLSQEWERVLSENRMLKMQLELAEKELNKLKEIELTLFRTLKTAEDTSSQITEQANKTAELYLHESRQKADEVLADARKRSKVMVQDAENQARYIKENILNDLKSMEHDFKAMEKYKATLVTQIRALANNAMESVERFERKFNQQSLNAKIAEISAPSIEDTVAQIDPGEPLIEQEATAAETTEEAVATSSEERPAEVQPTAPIAAVPGNEAPNTAVDDPVTAQGAEAAEAGLPVTEPEAETDLTPEAVAEPEPQAVHEESEPRKEKGGSFFDQI